MRFSKLGNLAKWCFAILWAALLTTPALTQQIHRNGFEGRQTGWLRGGDNVRAEETTHTLSNNYSHQGSTSEFIQIICQEGKNESNFANYYYPTQPAPIGEDLSASVWVKANRAGVQLQARLVPPRERNPKQIDEPLTLTLSGSTYKITAQMGKARNPQSRQAHEGPAAVAATQLRRDIDLTDAYIDRLTLNLYTGPGQIDVYIDDLEIGPVTTVKPPPAAPPPKNGTTSAPPRWSCRRRSNERGIIVRMDHNRLTVGGQPFFFTAIRYTDTPLKTLRDAGFNTVWFDAGVPTGAHRGSDRPRLLDRAAFAADRRRQEADNLDQPRRQRLERRS